MAKTTHFPLLFLVFISLLVASLSSISATCTFPASLSLSPPPHNVKGMFVFGSSYLDNGNNNFINTVVNVNYTPYGIDFPLGPSGRFTNGKNVVDLLGEELKLPPYIPVFYNPETKGEKIINGVDFASGGAGILDETGSFLGVTSLNQQIKNFEEVTLKDLEEQVGCRSSESLPNYLFVLGIGGNDYSINYFQSNSNNVTHVTLRDFTANLTTSLALQIQKPKQWANWIHLAEWCYNVTHHTAINMSPYQAIYGQPPPLLQRYIPKGLQQAELREWSQEREEIQSLSTNSQLSSNYWIIIIGIRPL